MFVLGSKKKDKNKEENFFLELLDFYKEYIGKTSKSIELLSELQEKYSDEYEGFVDFQKDPSSLVDIVGDIEDSEVGSILLLLFTKIAVLSSKMLHVYDLNPEQQKKLSEDLRTFIEDVEKSVEKLKKKKEENQ